MSGEKPLKRAGKRPGRKPSKIDFKAKLERSRQSARECRARKKLRYQYLEELVAHREKAIYSLREELNSYKNWCIEVDNGIVSENLIKYLSDHDNSHEATTSQHSRPLALPRVAPLPLRGGNPPITKASSLPEQSSAAYGGFSRASSFPETEAVSFSEKNAYSGNSGISGIYTYRPANENLTDSFYNQTRTLTDVISGFNRDPASDFRTKPTSQAVCSMDVDGANQFRTEPTSQMSRSINVDSADQFRTKPTHQICEPVSESVTTQFFPQTTYSSTAVSQSEPVTSQFDTPSDNTCFQDAFEILSKLEEASSSAFVSTCASSSLNTSYGHLQSANQPFYTEQPSTSTGVKGQQDSQPSWYSILTELEPCHSRQGAESTSGTPTLGTPKVAEDDVSLPRVLYDLLESTDSSDG